MLREIQILLIIDISLRLKRIYLINLLLRISKLIKLISSLSRKISYCIFNVNIIITKLKATLRSRYSLKSSSIYE